MRPVTPPEYVLRVLSRLESRGFGAYLVGGCVRDIFLCRRPYDWDVCTDALPEEVTAVFPGALPTGLKHGTVTVRSGGRHVEVTTFRSEGAYSDHRRPDTVRFISDLRSDLARRDFTMNAIALPLSGAPVDPFGGLCDIKNRLIRCVGSPDERFSEDALRMFRALRFSAQLDFGIEPQTAQAISDNAPLAAGLAPERMRDELEKILLSPHPEIVQDVMDCGLLAAFIPSPSDCRAMLLHLSKLPKNKMFRWTAFASSLRFAEAVPSAGAFLGALRLDGRTIRCGEAAADMCLGRLPSGGVEWKKRLAASGVECCECAAAAADVIFGGGHLRKLRAVMKSGECFSLHCLTVNGDDLLSVGLSGPEIGTVLDRLLAHVIETPSDNQRDALMALIKREV